MVSDGTEWYLKWTEHHNSIPGLKVYYAPIFLFAFLHTENL